MDFTVRGIRPLEFWELLQGSGTSNNIVWRKVMGVISSDWEDYAKFPPQGGLPSGKYVDEEVHDGQVNLSAAGRGNKGSGAGGGADVSPPPPEYRRPVYRPLADTGAMSRGVAMDGGMVLIDLVVAGQTQSRSGRDRKRNRDKDREGGEGEDINTERGVEERRGL